MKKFLSLTLALIFVALPICACEKNDTPKVNEDGVALFDEPIVVADSSGAYFEIAKVTVSTDELDSCLASLAKPADGFSLKHSVAKESDNENGAKEILLGNTCRAESADAMANIGYDDFSVTYANNKIIIAAHTPERLTEAVAFLKEKLLKVTDGRLEYIGNFTYRSNESLMVSDENSIADYKIVCGHDDLYIDAQKIQKYINESCGIKLDIIYDTKPKEGKEIVLGNAKRDISALTDSLKMGEGIIAEKDGDLLVAAKDFTSTTQLLSVFFDKYLSRIYTDSFNFKSDFNKTYNVYDEVFQDNAERVSGIDVRVMSFNVLCDLWGNPAASGRAPTVVKTILHYEPDVIGLQEASSAWHKEIKSLMKNTPYKLICTEHDHVDAKYGNLNFTPILYNSDTLTLKECDTKEYTEAKVKYMRTISWALFEVKATGEQFIMINTHYEAPGNNDEEKAENLEYRKAQTADMIAFIDEMEKEYNLPVLLTGDFNTTEGNDKTNKHAPYWDLINSGLHDSKKSADKIKRACTTWHELGSTVSTANAGSFDHIFGNSKVSFKFFNTLVDKMLMSAADHCPIYADVKFN